MAGWIAFGVCEDARNRAEGDRNNCWEDLNKTRGWLDDTRRARDRYKADWEFCQADCPRRIRDEGERITDLKDTEIDDIKQEHADETAEAELLTQQRLEELGESHEQAVREAQRLVGVPLAGFNDFVDDLDDEFNKDADKITTGEVDRFQTDEELNDEILKDKEFDITDTHTDPPKLPTSLIDTLFSGGNLFIFVAIAGASGFAVYRKKNLGYVFRAK